jgi:hypothetical protein
MRSSASRAFIRDIDAASELVYAVSFSVEGGMGAGDELRQQSFIYSEEGA